MNLAGPPEIVRDVVAALARRGTEAHRIELVSPLRERKGMRFAYRVDASDGAVLKARHFGSEENARRHFALRAGLEDAFAPALACDGAVVFEQWIEGTMLSAAQAESRSEEAGGLLGRLHAQALGPEVAPLGSTAAARAAAESDVEILRGAEALTADEAETIRGELARRDPRIARLVLIHKDFCAENMLIDADGRLRVIDNEQIAIEPAGFDLGRTHHRWPMSPAAWARFRRGYRATALEEPGALGFWKLVAALVGARVFLERIPERLDDTLALLRRFVAGEGLDEDDR